MKILLCSPDNGVTRNFMPHLWMFLLKRVEIAEFVRANDIRLVGSAVTGMAARAYKMADAIRAAGARVVFSGPHGTEVPDEPHGRAGEPRHADAIALGEADHSAPKHFGMCGRALVSRPLPPRKPHERP